MQTAVTLATTNVVQIVTNLT